MLRDLFGRRAQRDSARAARKRLGTDLRERRSSDIGQSMPRLNALLAESVGSFLDCDAARAKLRILRSGTGASATKVLEFKIPIK